MRKLLPKDILEYAEKPADISAKIKQAMTPPPAPSPWATITAGAISAGMLNQMQQAQWLQATPTVAGTYASLGSVTTTNTATGIMNRW